MLRPFIIVPLLCLLATTFFQVAPPPANAAAPGGVATITWGQSRADIKREVELLDRAGVKWIRTNVNWTGLEPDRKGEINQWYLDDLDFAIDQARNAGIKIIMPISDGVPYWASGDPLKYVNRLGKEVWDSMYPPDRNEDYGAIVRFVAEHFSQRGVHVYEIWNEPNSSWFWGPTPSASRYVGMLRAASDAVHSVDPDSTVLLRGLSHNDYDYLDDVYAAGGRDYFDGVAVHPYSWSAGPKAKWYRSNGEIAPDSFPAIKEVRRTMVRHGDGKKRVWVTEFGWSATSADGGVSPAKQARYLRRGYRYLDRLPWVRVALWYSGRNNPFMNDADTYSGRFGLFSTDWETKPAYRAFKRLAN